MTSTPSRAIRVVHVLEAVSGGVPASLAAMMRATPDLDHRVVLAPLRVHIGSAETTIEGVPITILSSKSVVSRYRELRATIVKTGADYIHLHSSFAGALVRLMPGVPRRSIIYSPHCYGFQRSASPWLVRGLLMAAEFVLGVRTRTIFAVSTREAVLAKRLALGFLSQVVVGSNASLVKGKTSTEAPVENQPIRIVTAGRISTQKDPAFFAELVSQLRRLTGHRFDAEWIGDGDRPSVRLLEREGVRISGWLDEEATLQRMRTAHIYVHTARWESSPISILNALQLGLPTVVRDVPSIQPELRTPLASSPASMAEAVLRLEDPLEWQRAASTSRTTAKMFTLEKLGDTLRTTYSVTPG